MENLQQKQTADMTEDIGEEEYLAYLQRRRKARLMQSRRENLSRRNCLQLRLLLLTSVVLLVCGLAAKLFRARPVSVTPDVRKPEWITENFLTPNPYSRPQTALHEVNAVVVHYVGNPGTTAGQNRDYFESLSVTKDTSASSHFVIGLEGEVIQCIPLDEISYCSNQRNNDTVSIECCHPDAGGRFTAQTYDSLVRLVRWLCDKYELDCGSDVIRHYDVTGKECPRYYVKNPDAWKQFLEDLKNPGE